MKIALAADHKGFKLKEELKNLLQDKYEIIDLGTKNEESVDFPIYGISLGEYIRDKKADLGIAICGTGIGISIIVNKVKDVMCAKISTLEEAKLAKEHNHANVLALSGSLDPQEAYQMIKTFIETDYFNDPKYIRRINQIKEYENAN